MSVVKQITGRGPHSKRQAKPKRTWREKLCDSKDFPKVAKIDSQMSKRWGEGTFVIPAPLEVDAAMRKVRRGKLTTIGRTKGSGLIDSLDGVG